MLTNGVGDGDLLPTRSQYAETHDWQVAVNHLYAGNADKHALWFSLPDIVASVTLRFRVSTAFHRLHPSSPEPRD